MSFPVRRCTRHRWSTLSSSCCKRWCQPRSWRLKNIQNRNNASQKPWVKLRTSNSPSTYVLVQFLSFILLRSSWYHLLYVPLIIRFDSTLRLPLIELILYRFQRPKSNPYWASLNHHLHWFTLDNLRYLIQGSRIITSTPLLWLHSYTLLHLTHFTFFPNSSIF